MGQRVPLSSGAPYGRRREPTYTRRRPEESVLYSVVQRQLESFLAGAGDLGFVRSYLLKDGRLHLSLMADGGIYSFEQTIKD